MVDGKPVKLGRTVFGQMVVGPPGSGKSTYCAAVAAQLGRFGRPVAVVNLDPANDRMPYQCLLDVKELISVEDVMEEYGLGPNGALIFCLEFLGANLDWLQAGLTRILDNYLNETESNNGENRKKRARRNEEKNRPTRPAAPYFLFDMPGQVETYTHESCVKEVVKRLCAVDVRLCAVHLVDAHYCSDPGKFIAVLLTSLSAMVNLELPHVNVLSKTDLIGRYGSPHFNLEFYTEVLDLSRLLDRLQDDPFFAKFKSLNDALIQVIEDYGLVSFYPISIEQRDSLERVLCAIDHATGYTAGTETAERRLTDERLTIGTGSRTEFQDDRLAVFQELFVDRSDSAVDGGNRRQGDGGLLPVVESFSESADF